jgi:hypothetical protein
MEIKVLFPHQLKIQRAQDESFEKQLVVQGVPQLVVLPVVIKDSNLLTFLLTRRIERALNDGGTSSEMRIGFSGRA